MNEYHSIFPTEIRNYNVYLEEQLFRALKRKALGDHCSR